MGEVSDLSGFLFASLAVWRLTHFFTSESGPFFVMEKIRQSRFGQATSSALACFECMSIWVAAGVSLHPATGFATWLLGTFAMSGFAILVERFLAEPVSITEVLDSRETSDELLQEYGQRRSYEEK
ncbi:hypothetical protein [Rhizobium leguminosarum]|uniref:hypothetical protein n=1 Tax=Rhizobium leguminosarum TaxID=384 RepID=UPI0013DADAF3|nr:hypothetical protein [Rhizobium leguminosarum]NEK35067.1 hypothetical protein [Rhizobium leguminosarum]